MMTETSFKNFNEKENNKVFGFISQQKLLFEQVEAVNTGSDTGKNTHFLSSLQ